MKDKGTNFLFKFSCFYEKTGTHLGVFHFITNLLPLRGKSNEEWQTYCL